MTSEKCKRESGPEDPTRQMVVTNLLHRRILEKNLENIGLHRGQHRVLMALSCHSFESQLQLAEELDVSAATIAVSLKALEKAGLVSREVKDEDTRSNCVELTDEGRRVVESAKDYYESLERAMYQDFTEEEQNKLWEYLNRLYHNMEQFTATAEKGENRETVC